MARIALAIVSALVLLVCPAAASEPSLPLKACTLTGGIRAVCGTFDVPEDRAHPGGRTISLRVAVLPSRGGSPMKDPIVRISGGPGGSAIADAAGMLAIFGGANASRDIVLVDQRGTGGSNRLECPVPRKRLSTPVAVQSFVRACLARMKSDPRLYTTVPAMDDLADVIRALGYAEVNLYGVSYGATAAQYFLAQHPELVRTVILDGATLLDLPVFERWAPNSQRALQTILARCARSTRCARAYPRARHEVFEVIEALRSKPVRLQGTTIDAATAAGALHELMLSGDGAAAIPWIAHRARLGDWTPLALTIDRVGDGALATLSRQVMFWSIVCNEPWARWNPARAAAASRGTYLAERATMNAQLVAAVCSAVPKVAPPQWSRARVASTRPVLFVVGEADPQDPLPNVAGATRELPNARIVVVPGAGHTAVQLGCMPKIATAFIEAGDASRMDVGCLVRYSPPQFVVR